jgi:hypothetical protein
MPSARYSDEEAPVPTCARCSRVLDDKNIDAVSIAPNHWRFANHLGGSDNGKDV